MNIGAAWKQMEAIRRQRWEQAIYFTPRHVPQTYPKSDEKRTDSNTKSCQIPAPPTDAK